MNAIKGVFHDGAIVLAEKADWPNDTEVIVAPVSAPVVGMREEDWPSTPEGIEAWIKWCESLEPFLTPEEEANWQAALREQAEYDKTHFDERARRLEKLWE